MKSPPRSSRKAAGGTAFLFPGSGSQHEGMGRALRAAFPRLRAELGRVNSEAGYDVAAAMDGPSSLLFPSLSSPRPWVSMEVSVALSLAVARSLLAAGARPPDACAGRSIGEYPAACFAGAFCGRECFRLVRRVAELGHRDCLAGAGLLVTVYGLARRELAAAARLVRESGEFCELVSFYDLPRLGFAAVRRSGLPALRAALKPFRHRVRVSKELGAFHSTLFSPLARDAAAFFKGADLRPPAAPVYMNLDARPETSPAGLRRKLAAALDHPVKWQETLARLLRDGVRTFVEMAPGAMLTEFICALPPDAEVLRTDTPGHYRLALRRLRAG